MDVERAVMDNAAVAARHVVGRAMLRACGVEPPPAAWAAPCGRARRKARGSAYEGIMDAFAQRVGVEA